MLLCDLDWKLRSDCRSETEGFNLVHRRPQVGVEMRVSDLDLVSDCHTIDNGTDLFCDPD
jgi:hypothetical protein